MKSIRSLIALSLCVTSIPCMTLTDDNPYIAESQQTLAYINSLTQAIPMFENINGNTGQIREQIQKMYSTLSIVGAPGYAYSQ